MDLPFKKVYVAPEKIKLEAKEGKDGGKIVIIPEVGAHTLLVFER